MRFVKTENLVKGMRLAKPIYNKNGVLLYDRDTKLTKQGINSIKNFNIIGIFILEPAEPLPPMTDEDIEFERFQTMSIFGLREDLNTIIMGRKPVNIDNLVKIIMKNYCKKDKKVNFMQNIRSIEDCVYKHSLNVAIMSAMIAIRFKLTSMEIRQLVYAALIHDIGKIMPGTWGILQNASNKKDGEIKSLQKGINLLHDCEFIPPEVVEILNDSLKIMMKPALGVTKGEVSLSAKILQISDVYDDLTAMKLDEEPTSDVVAIRTLINEDNKYSKTVVSTLVDSIKILYPGVCVELTNGFTGLVVKVNEKNVLRPMVLCFRDNNLYNLADNYVYDKIQIKDIMKTMDNRIKVDQSTVDEYLKKYS